nr:M23 family metallopeptidase [Nocardia brevicatena]
MNHRTTPQSPHRSRSGHRYRDDSESFDHFSAFEAPQADAQARRRNHLPAAAAQYAAAHDNGATYNFWADNDSWANNHADAADTNWSAAPEQSAWPESQTWDVSQDWHAEQHPDWQADQAWNAGQDWNEARSWTDGHTGPVETYWGKAPADHPTTLAAATQRADEAADPDDAIDSSAPGRRTRTGGAHRVPAPPGALKGRAVAAAVAAGAVVAAGQCALADTGEQQQITDYEVAGHTQALGAEPVSDTTQTAQPAAAHSPQMLAVEAEPHISQFGEMLQNGQEYAKQLAEAEAAKMRPLFAKFANGAFTSGFGARWGVQHLGVDIAAPIGTPIYAVADGTVIDAGPAAGFGMWVRLRHEDGTVTVYGHVDTTTVSVGEYVLAGDQIATVGNRGFSTGPHVHFEVWLNGSDKIDPLPWLATRGISLGQRSD